MKINQEGIDLIKLYEGCRLMAYKDIVGNLTIGFGHCGKDVREGLKIDSRTAEDLLAADLAKFEKGVMGMLKITPTAGQFSALVSFSYNVGLLALEGSHLLKKLNSGDLAGASLEFERWNKAGKTVVQGLANRRAAEKKLFES